MRIYGIIITCIYLQWVAMVFLVYFPRRFGMQLPLVAMVLREASALMRLSSIIIYIYMSVMLLVPRRTPLNAQRANVGPASNA